jgi:hypothetical protein
MSDIQYDLFGNPVTIAEASRLSRTPDVAPAAAETVGTLPPSGAATERPSPGTPGGAGDDDRASADVPAAAPTAPLPSLASPGAGAMPAGPGPTTPARPTASKARRTPAKPSAPTAGELAEGRALIALIEAMLEAARTRLAQRAGLLPVPSPRIDAPVLAAAAATAIEQPTLVVQARLMLRRRNDAGGDGSAATDTATNVAATDEPAAREDGHEDAEGADDDTPPGWTDDADVVAGA